jgi:hypothetical protein
MMAKYLSHRMPKADLLAIAAHHLIPAGSFLRSPR